MPNDRHPIFDDPDFIALDDAGKARVLKRLNIQVGTDLDPQIEVEQATLGRAPGSTQDIGTDMRQAGALSAFAGAMQGRVAGMPPTRLASLVGRGTKEPIVGEPRQGAIDYARNAQINRNALRTPVTHEYAGPASGGRVSPKLPTKGAFVGNDPVLSHDPTYGQPTQPIRQQPEIDYARNQRLNRAALDRGGQASRSSGTFSGPSSGSPPLRAKVAGAASAEPAGSVTRPPSPTSSTIWTPETSAQNTGMWHAGQGTMPNPEVQTPGNLRLLDRIKQMYMGQADPAADQFRQSLFDSLSKKNNWGKIDPRGGGGY